MTGSRRRRTLLKWGLAAFVAVTMPWADTALAGVVSDKAAEAERLLGEGDGSAAFEAFDQAVDAFWEAVPLQFNAAFFADWITGYGKYQPRSDMPFAAGETALIYIEPAAYSLTQTGDTFAIALAADLQIQTPSGLILAKADDFTSLDWQGRSKNRSFHAAINLGLPALATGEYLLLLTLRDEASGKSATATLPFVMGE